MEIQVELSQEQVDECLIMAKEDFEYYSENSIKNKFFLNLIRDFFVKKYAEALCTEILGIAIRGSYEDIPHNEEEGNKLIYKSRQKQLFLRKLILENNE